MQRNNIFTEIDKLIDKYAGKQPGVAAAAIKDSEVIYKRTVGLANLEYDIPIKEDTAFNLASVSKPITAMGIMILQEKGEIKYNDRIVDYFPELTHYCSDVTIQHLLNHTSGIINYYEILNRLNIQDINFTNNKCYDLLMKESNLLFKPGDKFDYSNSNYVLLALLIERVTSQAFDKFIYENIFKTLGMNNSLVFDERQPIVKNRAFGYGKKEGLFYCNYIGALTTGDGCVFSTIEDMIKFEKALYSDIIVSKQVLEEVLKSAKLNNGEDAGYAFGWETHRSTKTLKRLHHSGADNGCRSLITTFPDHRLTVILLSNYDGFTWEDRLNITDEFVKIII